MNTMEPTTESNYPLQKKEPLLTATDSAAMDNDAPSRLWTKEFLILTACNLLVFLNLHMILSSLPLYMREHFNAGDFYVSLCTSLMALAAIISRLFSARALELGKRNVILFGGLLIALLGTVGYYFSATVILLLVMRVIFGFGFGMYSTTFPTMVSDIIPRKRMGEGMGYFGLSTTISMSMGPLIGMSIEKNYGFTPLIVIGSLFILILFPLAYSLVKGQDKKIAQQKILADQRQLAAQAQAKLDGIVVETIDNQPIPQKPSTFEKRLLLPSLLNFLMSLTYGGLVSFIALFGKEANLANPGYFFLFNALAVIAVRPFSGKIYDRKGPKALIVPGAILLIAGLLLLSFAHSTLGLFGAALCYGIGWGALQPTMQTWMIQVVSPHQRGMANGMFLNSLDMGVALGAMILGTIAGITSYTSMYRFSALFIVLYIVVGIFYMVKAKGTPAQTQHSIHIKIK